MARSLRIGYAVPCCHVMNQGKDDRRYPQHGRTVKCVGVTPIAVLIQTFYLTQGYGNIIPSTGKNVCGGSVVTLSPLYPLSGVTPSQVYPGATTSSTLV